MNTDDIKRKVADKTGICANGHLWSNAFMTPQGLMQECLFCCATSPAMPSVPATGHIVPPGEQNAENPVL